MDLADELIGTTNRVEVDQLLEPDDILTSDSKWNKKGKANTSKNETSLTQRLNLNIVSIIIGAIFFMTIATWVDTLRAGCSGVLDEDKDKRYILFYRRVWSASLVTLIAIVASIILYIWYRGTVSFKVW